jgi:hypothetical protein
MPKHKSSRTSKRKAIQAALGQLGWQASGKDVVALLAGYGVEVTEELVNKVKVDGLKKSNEVVRQKATARMADQRRDKRAMRKVPQQRTYRR